MSTQEKTLSGLAAPVREALDGLTGRLNDALGDALVSVALYGSAARGEYVEGSSDINVLIVVQQADVATLDRLTGPLAAARRGAMIHPMIMGEAELTSALDVFPVKFLDMRRGHLVLHGADVLGPHEVDWRDLRLRLEQQLRTSALRLRHQYLREHARPERLDAQLHQSLGTLLVSLDAMVYLLDPAHAWHARREDVLDAADALGLGVGALRRALAAVRGEAELDGEQTRALYCEVMEEARALADHIDRAETPAGKG